MPDWDADHTVTLPDVVLADLRAAWRWPGAAARVRRYLATPDLDPTLRADAADLLLMADHERRKRMLGPLSWLIYLAGACVVAPILIVLGAPHLLQQQPDDDVRKLHDELLPRQVYLPPPPPPELDEPPVLVPEQVTGPVRPIAPDDAVARSSDGLAIDVSTIAGAIGTANPLARPTWLSAMQDASGGGGGGEGDATGMRIPEGMVYVPPGSFGMGSLPGVGEPHEHPRHQVELSAFAIDRDEVSVAAFTRWCNSNRDRCGWTPDDSSSLMADHPATGVTWTEAQSFCSAMGKALPTEAQWEYAASPDPAAETQAPYPWGDAPPTCGQANFMDCHLLATVPLGSTTGATALGIRDMAGNAREWVHDAYGPYWASRQVDPRGTGDGDLRVLRGGSFGGAAEDIRVSDRDVGDPAQRSVYNGFRCAVPVVGVVDDASTDRGNTEGP